MSVAALHGDRVSTPPKPFRKAISPGQLLIGGKWVDAASGETMDVTDPTTKASITRVQKAGAIDAEKAIYDEFVEKFSAMAKAAVLGDPLDPKTQLGPIATKAEYDKILTCVEAGKQSSARLTAGGAAPKIDGKGLFIQATVFADATNDLKISREEIFGPVVPVIPFETEDDAIRFANDIDFGLAPGIQTSDLGKALRLADKIKAGTVWLNTWHN